MNNSNDTDPTPLDTTDFQPSQPAAPEGESIAHFQLRRELGRGAFGVVYVAFDPILNREVALKVPKFSGEQQVLQQRFLREARAAAGLKHPNIVTVFQCSREGEPPYLAMELIDGDSLARRLAQGRPT